MTKSLVLPDTARRSDAALSASKRAFYMTRLYGDPAASNYRRITEREAERPWSSRAVS